MTTREDRAAIAVYLTALRDAGPDLSPALIEAFERLTPGQLDTLAARVLEAPAAGARLTPPPPARRPRLGEGLRTTLVLAGAFAVSLAGVVWASLSFDQGPPDPAPSSFTDPTGVLEGIGQASSEGW